MPINPELAMGATIAAHDFEWTTSDVLLYHLALGAGNPPTEQRELRYTYERDPHVLPTFAIVAPQFHQFEPPSVSMPGVQIDLAAVLHGGQEIIVNGPIPSEGRAHVETRITDIYDKGKAAVIAQETVMTDPTGAPMCTMRSTIFARGEGGFGGKRGPSNRVAKPEREPDFTSVSPTQPQQALLYRLCGDRNPLHADPEFANAAGFSKPILHGLCTYGVVCKAIADEALDGNVHGIRSYAARFTGVVFPGETIRTYLWDEGDGQLVGAAYVAERDDAPVLSDILVATG